MSGAAPPEEADLAALGRRVADDAVHLVRAEIELAKAQMAAAARRMILAAIAIVIALVLLLIAVIDALGALPEAFGPRLLGSSWAGWLVLGGVFLILAALFAVLGTFAVRRSFSQGKQTVDSLKEDAEWLRRLTKRDGSAS